jgi:N-hydroxyarylamine O-acetyltransferase
MLEMWAKVDTVAYLNRIGYRGSGAPTEETLRALHLAHLLTVPFENLDIHLGRPIDLDERALFAKIVRRRRGGFCYELNGLFASLLRELGFAVTMLAAQFPREDGRTAPEMDHLVLLVRTEDSDEPRLVDVGAGRDSFIVPLRTSDTGEQSQPAGSASFRLVPEGDACRLQRREPGGEWEQRYLFSWQPRVLADFEAGCHFHQTSPDSNFPRARICTLLTPAGRVTLSERTLIVTTHAERMEQELDDETAVRKTLRSVFGIELGE